MKTAEISFQDYQWICGREGENADNVVSIHVYDDGAVFCECDWDYWQAYLQIDPLCDR